MQKIPYYPLDRINAVYGDAFTTAFSSVLQSGWFIRGKENLAFEQNFASFCGAKHCVGVGNGLEALSLILKAYIALGVLKKNDKVIVPATTFVATWLAVRAAGLEPLPAEVSESDSLLTREGVLSVWNSKAKAVIAVHLYGKLAPMESLEQLAKEKGFLLIEDAAQAHGAIRNGRKAGSFGNAAGFSFYPTKNLGALGDAGAVVTSDSELAECVKKIANYGSSKKYIHELEGENSRLDEVQAAFLSKKLTRLECDNKRRIEIANTYLQKIKNPLIRLPKYEFLGEHVFHIFAIHSPYREALQKHLERLGIETLIHYPIPPHHQGAFRNSIQTPFPISEKLSQETLSIPLHPQLEDSEISQIIEAVNSFSLT